MLKTTTYTVLRNDGEVIARGLSLADAAHEMLTHDGHNYKLSNEGEENPENYRLLVSQKGNGGTNYAAWPDYDSEGKGDSTIWEKVISMGGVCGTTAMTDSEYDALIKAVHETLVESVS